MNQIEQWLLRTEAVRYSIRVEAQHFVKWGMFEVQGDTQGTYLVEYIRLGGPAPQALKITAKT